MLMIDSDYNPRRLGTILSDHLFRDSLDTCMKWQYSVLPFLVMKMKEKCERFFSVTIAFPQTVQWRQLDLCVPLLSVGGEKCESDNQIEQSDWLLIARLVNS